MRVYLRKFILFFLVCGQLYTLQAQPTSLIWTNCTTDILGPGLIDLGSYSYFTVFNRRGRGQYAPHDVSILLGVFLAQFRPRSWI